MDFCCIMGMIFGVSSASVLLALAIVLLTYVIFFSKKCKSIVGKHVLITGGSSGIGKSLAILAAKEGANVTIVARNEDKLKEALEVIKSSAKDANKQKITYVSVDITARNDDNLKHKLENVSEESGPVFMLVNCAGTSVAGRFEEIDSNLFYSLMDVNYFGSVNITRTLLPQMKSAGQGGAIVFVSSMAGLIGLYGYTAYSGTKYAIRGFAEALEMELKPFGIDVSVNFPPDTDTPGFEEEQKGKPEETRIISETAALFQPDVVAKNVLDGAKYGNFFQSVGMDGWMITTINAGMANCSVDKLLVQVFLSGLLRLVGWCYRQYFNHIVSKCKSKREMDKRKD